MSLFVIPPFVLLTFAMALVKIYALMTVRKQRWLTRQVAVVDGQVVRTGAGRGMSAPDVPPGMVTPVAPSPTDTLVLEDAQSGSATEPQTLDLRDRADVDPCPTDGSATPTLASWREQP
jgi:hypothetical protein